MDRDSKLKEFLERTPEEEAELWNRFNEVADLKKIAAEANERVVLGTTLEGELTVYFADSKHLREIGVKSAIQENKEPRKYTIMDYLFIKNEHKRKIEEAKEKARQKAEKEREESKTQQRKEKAEHLRRIQEERERKAAERKKRAELERIRKAEEEAEMKKKLTFKITKLDLSNHPFFKMLRGDGGDSFKVEEVEVVKSEGDREGGEGQKKNQVRFVVKRTFHV